jgi:hypothetical protein
MDLECASDLFQNLSPQEEDLRAFKRICDRNIPQDLQAGSGVVVEAEAPQTPTFLTPGEMMEDLQVWETYLKVSFDRHKELFEDALDSLGDPPNVDMVRHLQGLKEYAGNRDKVIFIGKDLTRPGYVHDLCGQLLFYIPYRPLLRECSS